MSDAKSNDELKAELKKLRTDIEGIAGEIKVKVHLAGMDAKDAWSDLEPKIRDFEDKATRAADTTVAEMKGLAAELKERARRIKESL